MQLTSIKVRVSFLCVRVRRSAIEIDRVAFTHCCKVNTNKIKAFVETTITVEFVETLVDGARFAKRGTSGNATNTKTRTSTTKYMSIILIILTYLVKTKEKKRWRRQKKTSASS